MIRLDTTTRKLQVVLGAAPATNQLPCVASWSDKSASAYSGGTTPVNTNGTTAVDMVAAPAASTVRDVDHLTVRNSDTAAATVTVRLNDNTTLYTLWSGTLNPSETLEYTHADGFQIVKGSPGDVILGVRTVTATTALDASYDVVLCNNSSDITLNLPAAAGNAGLTYYLKKVGNNASLVTIDANASELIDGALTLVLYLLYDAVRIVCDGTGWQVIGDGRRSHVARMSRAVAQSIPTGTATKVNLDTADVDQGGMADPTTNNRVNIRRAGKYLVTGTYYTNTSLANTLVDTLLYVNGVIRAFSRTLIASGNTDTCTVAVDEYDLAAGDFVELYVRHSAAGSVNTSTGTEFRPRLGVVEVRP